MAEMTPADVMALNGNCRRDDFLEGNGLIILILFFLISGWGNGFGFGGGNAALQGSLTRAELADGFNMNEVQRNQSDIKDEIFGINSNILNNKYEMAVGNAHLQNQIAENRYSAALQNQNLQSQMASCCCEIKTALHAEGEATRALIQQNTIQELRDNLQAAQLQLGNVAQTQNLTGQIANATDNILRNLGRYYTNPPVNPYTCYNTCNTCGYACA